jgi:hypothetical protein
VEGLSGVCRRELGIDPMSGILVVFRNKSMRILRVLGYNSVGFFLYESQIAVGRFPWWPRDTGDLVSPMAARELLVLLCGGDPTKAHFAKEWKRVAG